MQCVFATPYLNEFFLTEYNKCQPLKGGRLSKEYCTLVQSVQRTMAGGASSSSYSYGDTSTITPSRLKDEVSRVATQFSGYGQQDAQEFLRFFLDGLHEELNRVTKKPPYKELKFEESVPIE